MEILLVDDSTADVELTLHALQENGHAPRIHVVRDGEEALNFLFCRESPEESAGTLLPHLILLDLKLPKVDGLAVLSKLKGDRRTRSIPVIVLTSSREDRDLASSYELGANSYIQKPVDFDRFREAVQALGLYWLRTNQPPPRPAWKSSTGESG